MIGKVFGFSLTFRHNGSLKAIELRTISAFLVGMENYRFSSVRLALQMMNFVDWRASLGSPN
ncbi:unnamed protein product [Acidithrix sp. C25]|nr:unnamed protein product [Acidithrix sp. C25]